jgi:hypothetical protein
MVDIEVHVRSRLVLILIFFIYIGSALQDVFELFEMKKRCDGCETSECESDTAEQHTDAQQMCLRVLT